MRQNKLVFSLNIIALNSAIWILNNLNIELQWQVISYLSPGIPLVFTESIALWKKQINHYQASFFHVIL